MRSPIGPVMGRMGCVACLRGERRDKSQKRREQYRVSWPREHHGASLRHRLRLIKEVCRQIGKESGTIEKVRDGIVWRMQIE